MAKIQCHDRRTESWAQALLNAVYEILCKCLKHH